MWFGRKRSAHCARIAPGPCLLMNSLMIACFYVVRQILSRCLSHSFVLLPCVSNYPASQLVVNLSAIETMRQAVNLPIGYSDHTTGIEIALAAVALGAVVLEKHFTLDCTLPGPDHAASLEPPEFASMVRGVRLIEAALGDGRKEPRESELHVRELVRRSVTLTLNLQAGDVLKREYLDMLRPGTGIAPRDLDRVVGKVLVRDLESGHTLVWSDLK